MSFLSIEGGNVYGSGAYGAGPYGGRTPHLPELCVEIDFTNDPTDSTRVWTDVTSDVRLLDFHRAGRNNELQRTAPGTLEGVLNNQHGHYDPFNVSSPHYPGVKRSRWMRVRARWSGVEYSRWQGLIDAWPQTWPAGGKDAVVNIRATDALKVLALFDLGSLSFGEQTTDARVADVLDAAGITDYTVDAAAASSVIASGTFAEGSFALNHLLDVEATENGLLFAEGDGGIVFQGRHYRLVNSGTSLATIGDSEGQVRYREAELDFSDDDVWNDVSVTPDGGSAQQWSDSTSQDQHFARRLNKSLLISDGVEALSAAQYLVARYADPSPRIPSLELLGARDTDTWPTILAMGNSDRFTWERAASWGTIAMDVFVEQVGDRIVPGHGWTVSVQLSPAVDQNGWVLGDDAYGLLGESTRVIY